MNLTAKVPFNKPFIAGKELYYIAKAISSSQCLSGNGFYTKLCQSKIEEILGASKSLLTHSCTAALEMAAILANIGPGDEVIMPSYTFVSTANAFVLRGGVPVFIDITPDTLNIDPHLIESAITNRTKAIVPVHYAGKACDMSTIMAIARKHNLLVIEDAAQAMLTKDINSGKYLGTIGDIGCLSFHETKNIISGEGGALLVNNDRFIERSEILWEKGTNRRAFIDGVVDKYTWVDIGSSYLPSDMIAAFLFAQLEQAEEIIDKRVALCEHYHTKLIPLAKSGLIHLPKREPQDSSNGHIFFILLDSVDIRAKLIHFLNNLKITPTFHYVPLHSSPAGMRFGKVGSEMKFTNDVASRVLRLPLFFEMSFQEVDYVCNAINQFFVMEAKQ